MKDDKEVLSFDPFEEDDFMLNKVSPKQDYSIDTFNEDDIIDTFEEKDHKDGIDFTEEVSLSEIRKENQEKKEEELKQEKKAKKEKKKKVRVKKEKVKKEKNTLKKNNEVKNITYYIQLGFVCISALFILGCCIFYGSRMIKFYRMFHPKATNGETIELIKEAILKNSPYQTEGEGLYRVGGASVYKGTNVDNYFKYSGLLWRIVSINVDGTIDLVLDEPINSIYYNDKNTLYNESDLRSYLNKKFIKNIDDKYLDVTPFCADIYEDVPSINCKNYITEDKTRVLTVSEFINTVVDEKTYITNNVDMLWLVESDKNSNWIINGSNISTSKPNTSYYVKPVIRIKRTATLGGGTGTLEDPFYIEKDKNELSIGKYVKLGTDVWSIYEINDNNIKLALSTNLNRYERFSTQTNKFSSTDKTGLYNYLNTTYYNLLSYKDKLIETEWNIGSYNGKYEEVETVKEKAKIGTLSVSDLKLNMYDSNYYLLTPSQDNTIFYYQDGLMTSKISLTKAIRPAICIAKESILEGKGTLEDPYVLGGAE